MKRKRLLTLIGSVCLILVLAALLIPGCAKEAAPTTPAKFPTRDIRIVIPWGVGGGTDAICRKSAYLGEMNLPVDIYCENVEGGVSGVGVSQVMTAHPDGYTIGSLTYDSVVTVPLKELVPGYDLNKLAFICRMTTESRGVVVRADAPWQTLDELIEDAKARPGEIREGVDALGSGSHLGFLKFEQAAGVKFKYAPYPGGAGGQKEALLSGELDVVGATGFGDYFPLIDAGEARGLAIFAPARLPRNPDVPTAKELGYDVEHGSFVILAAPAGTPKEVVETLEKAFHIAHQTAEFQDWLAEIGVEASWLDSEATTKFVLEFQRGEFEMVEELRAAGVL